MRKRIGKRIFISLLLTITLLFLSACGGGGSGEKGGRPAGKEAQTARKQENTRTDVEPLGDVNPIPEDGIITKEQFAAVAGEDRDISFVGETRDGIKYTWVYHAAQIQNPEDQDLRIVFEAEEDLDKIKQETNNANDALKMTMYGKGLICPPTLTVELPVAWQSDTGLLLKEQNDKLAQVSEVTIQSQPVENADKEEQDKNTEEKGSTEEKGNTEEKDAGIETLTQPAEGTTILTMTVLSLDGDSYIVGGITDKDKLAAINQKIQSIASANANASQGSSGETASAGDQGDSSSGSGGTGSSSSSGSGSGKSSGGTSSSDSSGSGSGKSGSGSSSSGSGSGDISYTESGGGSSGSASSGSGSSGSGDSGSKSSDSGTSHTCTISINCSTILNNMDNLTAGKEEFVPSNGWILKATKVSFTEGESVHDVLQRVCKDKGIHMESSFSPVYNSAYVEGINQLYEFDCGELSGWMYNVNGWFPNYGCSKYTLSDGDTINWVYTCDLGKDVGDNSMY